MPEAVKENGLEKVVILGARQNGHGKVVLTTLQAAGKFEVVGFIDDKPELLGQIICGVPVIGTMSDVRKLAGKGVGSAIVGVGDGSLRQKLSHDIIDSGLRLVNCIHPSAVIAPRTDLGVGVFVGPNAVVVAGARIGDNVIINTAATVDHDCVIEACATICPGAHLAGRVTVREGAFLGTGAVVVPDVTIGAWSVVGAGAVVVRDVPAQVTVVGVPARPVDAKGSVK